MTRQRTSTKATVDQTESATGRSERGRERVPMGATKRLTYNQQDPNYYYRWMADKDGRLQQALAAGYEFVKEDGKEVKRRKGQVELCLMRQPMEYHIEDQNLKEKQIIGTINDEQVLQDGEYLPDGRHHVIQKDDEYDPLA